MNIFLTCLLIAVSLSMDAFSLSLIYGTYGLSKKNQLLLALIVGIFHLVMPLLGLGFGNIIMNYLIFNVNWVVGIIFFIIGLEMLISSKKEEEVKVLISFLGFLFFGLSVSIDSLTTGIGLSAISNNYIGVALLFMVVSAIFTYMGLNLGNKLSKRFGKCATLCGGIMMIILSLSYIIGG